MIRLSPPSPENDAPKPTPPDEPPTGWSRWLLLGAALVLFVVGIQFLRGATSSLAPTLERFFDRFVRGDLSALGFSWLASYLLTNGSLVAGIALAFFEQKLLSPSGLSMAIAGSRLGAAGIVLLIGAVDYFFREGRTLRESCSMGVLVFVVTHAITLPAAGGAYVWTRSVGTRESLLSLFGGLHVRLPGTLEHLGVAFGSTAGGPVAFLSGLGLLVASIWSFDRALETVDVASMREAHLPVVSNRWLACLLGLGVTAVTTSVTFSLGLLVPVYNRGHLRDEELVPYIMGANVGTLTDTLLIGLVVKPAGGLAVTVYLAAGLAVTTGLALVAFDGFWRFCRGLHRWAVRDALRFGLFAIAVGLAPLAIMAVAWL